MALKKIVSFGYKHAEAPDAVAGVVVVDVREMFRNPYYYRHLREKTGHDPEVQEFLTKGTNFLVSYAHLRERITTPGTETAYIGCTGGRHRSVFLAERLGQELGVPVEHRDLLKP